MNSISITNLPAGAALRKGQMIRRDTGTWVAAVATNAEAVCGSTVASGELVNAIISGPAEVECAAALTVGGRFTCDANGRAVDATGTEGHVQMGIVLHPGKAAVSSKFTLATVCLALFKDATPA